MCLCHLKVHHDHITNALDAKQHCAAIIIDLTKAFDFVDHFNLLNRFDCIGVSGHSLAWLTHCTSLIAGSV